MFGGCSKEQDMVELVFLFTGSRVPCQVGSPWAAVAFPLLRTKFGHKVGGVTWKNPYYSLSENNNLRVRINSSGSSSWKMSLEARFCRNTPICLLCEIVHLRQITFSLLDGVKDSKQVRSFFFLFCPVGRDRSGERESENFVLWTTELPSCLEELVDCVWGEMGGSTFQSCDYKESWTRDFSYKKF